LTRARDSKPDGNWVRSQSRAALVDRKAWNVGSNALSVFGSRPICTSFTTSGCQLGRAFNMAILFNLWTEFTLRGLSVSFMCSELPGRTIDPASFQRATTV
jgi:hypothetical protein